MKAYQGKSDGRKIEIPIKEALECVKAYNKEFCRGRSNKQIIDALKTTPIHTNFSRYWIEETRSTKVLIVRHVLTEADYAEARVVLSDQEIRDILCEEGWTGLKNKVAYYIANLERNGGV